MEDNVKRGSIKLAAVLAIALMLFSACSPKEAPVTITHHSDVSFVTGVAKYQDYIYCATKGGLVRWEVPEGNYAIYTTADGLPSNVLTDVDAAADGNLWIGSVDGIVSFDGEYFKVYDESDGLPSPEIKDTAVDRSGKLWAGTQKGAASFDNGRFTYLADEKGPTENPIECIYFDLANNMWIGTKGRGLMAYLEDQWYRAGTREGLLVNTSETIVQAWDRSMWSASNTGISRFDGIGWQTFSSLKHFGTYSCRELHSTENRLWFFTDNGVHASQGADWFHFSEDEGLISNEVNSGKVFEPNEVLIASDSGLSIIQNDKIENYFIPNCPRGHNGLFITTDDRNRIWYGAWESGVNLYDEGYWTQVASGPAFSEINDVRSMVFTDDGGIVFNTTKGVVFQKDNDWKIETRRNGVSGDDVRCGIYDKEGNYWAGTASGICYRNEKGKWKRFRSLHGLPSEDTWSCAMDNDGTIWFGTSAGIVSFTGDTLTDRTEEAGLGAIDVRSIEVIDGAVLFGTDDGKLIEYRDGNWDSYGKNRLKTDSGVYDIAQAPDGSVWIATNGDGLICLDNGNSLHLTVKDGMPSDFVKSVTFRGDEIWAACYGGVAEIKRQPAE